MENWNNLSHFITLEQKNTAHKQQLSQQMVEFAMKGDKAGITKLLKMGASANCYENVDNLTPLIASIRSNQVDLARYLLKVGATVSYRPFDSDALWEALRSEAHNFLELFIYNKCPLTLEHDMNNMVFIEEEEDGTGGAGGMGGIGESKSKEPITNNTALIFATKQSDVKSVELLLRHYNIKVNERDGLGNTALHYNMYKESLSSEDMEIGKMLLAAGADTNATNLDGLKPEDMIRDYAAKSVLLSGKLENTLPIHDDPEPVIENPNVTKTANKRIKI